MVSVTALQCHTVPCPPRLSCSHSFRIPLSVSKLHGSHKMKIWAYTIVQPSQVRASGGHKTSYNPSDCFILEKVASSEVEPTSCTKALAQAIPLNQWVRGLRMCLLCTYTIYVQLCVFLSTHRKEDDIFFILSAFLQEFTFWLVMKKELIRSVFIFAFYSLYSPVTGYLQNQIKRDHEHPNLDRPLTDCEPNQ